jgi:uncharacterized protein with GYD domain
MPTFMVFLNWTDQGVRNLKEGPKRAEIVKGLIERNGGKLLSNYIITGQYDVAFTAEMPSGEAMTKVTIAINASGNARTTTSRAYKVEEFGKLIGEAL